MKQHLDNLFSAGTNYIKSNSLSAAERGESDQDMMSGTQGRDKYSIKWNVEG